MASPQFVFKPSRGGIVKRNNIKTQALNSPLQQILEEKKSINRSQLHRTWSDHPFTALMAGAKWYYLVPDSTESGGWPEIGHGEPQKMVNTTNQMSIFFFLEDLNVKHLSTQKPLSAPRQAHSNVVMSPPLLKQDVCYGGSSASTAAKQASSLISESLFT